MRHALILGTGLLVLTGCVSPQSQQLLNSYTQQCAAGDPNACAAASIQTQANQQEMQGNANVVLGVAGVLLGGAIAADGVAVVDEDCCWGPGGVYRHGYHGAGFYGRDGGRFGRPGHVGLGHPGGVAHAAAAAHRAPPAKRP
jgi:hypothetical protein